MKYLMGSIITLTFSVNAFATDASCTSSDDTKFYYLAAGAIVAAIITAITATFTTNRTNKSQQKILKATLDNNIELQDQKINKEQEYLKGETKRKNLIAILETLSTTKFMFSTTNSYLEVTKADVESFRKSFVKSTLDLRKAQAMAIFYFPDLSPLLTELNTPIEEFWLSVENHIQATSEDSRNQHRQKVNTSSTEITTKIDGIVKAADQVIKDWHSPTSHTDNTEDKHES